MNIEKRSIDFIPEEERHGRAGSLFTIWFGGNMQVTTLVAGALSVVSGLNLFWSIIAIVLGNLVGAVFMASHSAQGPKLGIPQMIQSRAQFGIIGAVIPLIVAIFMYIGFFASSNVLGAQAISSSFSIPLSLSIVIMGILAFIVAVFGYDLIHAMERYFSILFAIVFLIVTIIAFKFSLPAGSWSLSQFNFKAFMLTVTVTATWQIAYAPYVADYSRYLPSKTSLKKTFWYTYAGTTIGTIWMMILGCVLTLAIPKFLDNSSAGLAKLFGPNFAFIIYIVVILGILAACVFNLYGAFMSITTTLEPFIKLKVTAKNRFWLVFVSAVIGVALALWGYGGFLNHFEDLISFLSYFLVPWTAINLIDYYFLRKGDYDIQDIFNINGRYGALNWVTIISYLIAVLIEIPFMKTSVYTGPIATFFGGVDVSWVVGLIIPVILYYYPSKKKMSLSTYNERLESNKSL
ncbi:purine-cytosine permease family protein [Scopulibacillus cellulosilyticus]|uniref:Purine-cytosine permease family protein n=1 Tax=Scopulibacillus cellulosilyticus TaxID=2665665 RepID=A0ABW2PXR6_9BACL